MEIRSARIKEILTKKSALERVSQEEEEDFMVGDMFNNTTTRDTGEVKSVSGDQITILWEDGEMEVLTVKEIQEMLDMGIFT